MKKSIFALLLSHSSLIAISQDLSVSSSINDSVAPGQYHYFIEGSVILNEGMTCFVELMDSSLSNVIFSGHFAYDTPEDSNLPGFEYNAMEKHYRFDLGNYDSELNVLKIWTTMGNETINEVLIQK